MISLGLICKQPDNSQSLSSLTLQAASTLKRYCQNTWVSGEMVRKIWKLNQLVMTVIESPIPSSNSGPVEELCVSTNLLTDQPDCDSLSSNLKSNTDNPLPPPAESSTKSPGIANSVNAFGPGACFDQSQIPPNDSAAEFSNLLMTDFDFEQTTNNFSLGIDSSGNPG